MDGFKRQTIKKPSCHSSATVHGSAQKRSATLNRRFVKRPVLKKSAPAPATTAESASQPQITSAALRAAATLQRRQQIAAQSTRDSLKISIRDNDQPTLKSAPAPKITKIAPVAPVAPAPKLAPQVSATPDTPATLHPRVQLANAHIAARKAAAVTPPRLLSAQELKDRAIRQALQKVATMSDDQQTATIAAQMTGAIEKKKHFWHRRKFAAALSVAAIAIAALGYLVHLNLPDLSVQVAAMQTGIENAYPKYIPQGYRLDGLVTEKNGRLTMHFSGQDHTNFSLAVEKSSWDSHALLANFVTPEWDDEYTLIKDQGLTIYLQNSNATWVNGGIHYLLTDDFNLLTKQQLHNIAISF